MSGMYGGYPFGSTTYTTSAPLQGQQQGGLLGGIPGGGAIPGMLSNGYSGMTGSNLLGGSASPMALPMLYAMLIGTGKNLESSNANNGIGKTLLGGLAPSGSQIAKDPIGMGLPTLFGMPFLTPFTSSKAAQDTKPEWSSLFKLGQY